MKLILVMIAAVVLVGCGKGAKLIADPFVEEKIRTALNKPTGKLTDADLVKVTQLFFNGAKITDTGLKAVAKLQQLTELYFISTQITDVGLKEIAKMQKLTKLYLIAFKVTDAGVAELKKALPKCDIKHW